MSCRKNAVRDNAVKDAHAVVGVVPLGDSVLINYVAFVRDEFNVDCFDVASYPLCLAVKDVWVAF